MQTRFLLGPAGSGKTQAVLAEIRAALQESPDGPPLVLLTPKQATFQLERQLLAHPDLPGFTRLQILSFDRLARFVLNELAGESPDLLDEEGRVMVLRALLAREQSRLDLFRATARLPGLARQLSELLRELQRARLGPARLEALAAEPGLSPALRAKLGDVARILAAYHAWLEAHGLEDADHLLDVAAERLRAMERTTSLRLGGLWLDGFAEMTPQELNLLVAVLPVCERATLAFCLEREPVEDDLRWLSTWSVIAQTFRRCFATLSGVPGNECAVEVLAREPARGRFAGNPVLAHLEATWTASRAWPGDPDSAGTIRLWECPDTEAEAVVAARAIRGHVRSGGRFRECAVLLRSLEGCHDAFRRVFQRYEIPCFLDRRESVSHHPLAELVRGALRTVAYGWRPEDWFTTLKCGLLPATEEELDQLENTAIEHGWDGSVWQSSAGDPGVGVGVDPALAGPDGLRARLAQPFLALARRLSTAPDGPCLAQALRELWADLDVTVTLASWRDEAAAAGANAGLHETVLEQMNRWLDNVARAFPGEPMSLPQWLPVVEAGLGGLTVGVIPPALDQVLIGAVDRSRNPELRLAIIAGLNEGVFPAIPRSPILLTDDDREQLGRHQAEVGLTRRGRLGHERYFAYIAFTRAAERLVLTWSRLDADGAPRNASPLVDEVRRMFPSLEPVSYAPPAAWGDVCHAAELPFVPESAGPVPEAWVGVASVAAWRARRVRFAAPPEQVRLEPAATAALYGSRLRSSVSRLERFAECPFRFFVATGLRAEERRVFEADARRRGSFQHEVLRVFHEELRAAGQRWRDLAPDDARVRVRRIAAALAPEFERGVLVNDERDRLGVRHLSLALEEFIAVLVAWMPRYGFDPHSVELSFGEGKPLPPWILPLGSDRTLVFEGQIDRIDLCPSGDGEALVVVIDYKSRDRRLDALKLEHGIQLQLPAYLAMLRQVGSPRAVFGVDRLRPAGMFYVDLRGHPEAGEDRAVARSGADEARRLAYQHAGRFARERLARFDTSAADRPAGLRGEQFNFRLTTKGELNGACREPVAESALAEMLDRVEAHLRDFGGRIFSGEAAVDPYRHGRQTPCEFCDYRPVCRIDPWTHNYRAPGQRLAPGTATTPAIP